MPNPGSPRRSPLRRFYIALFAVHLGFTLVIEGLAYTGNIPRQITRLPHYDTLLHFLLVGLVGFCLDGILSHRRLFSWLPWPRLGALLAIGGAAIEEGLQALSPRRTVDPVDFIADVIGILVLAEVARWISRRAQERAARREAESGPERRGGTGARHVVETPSSMLGAPVASGASAPNPLSPLGAPVASGASAPNPLSSD